MKSTHKLIKRVLNAIIQKFTNENQVDLQDLKEHTASGFCIAE